MGTRHEPPHPYSPTLFAYKKAHYLCKLLLNVQLLNCASTYLDMYVSPAVMQVQFGNWLFKVRLLHSQFWPLEVWLRTGDWRVWNRIFVQLTKYLTKQILQKMCDFFQFSKLDRLGKSMFILFVFHSKEARHNSCITNFSWTDCAFSYS